MGSGHNSMNGVTEYARMNRLLVHMSDTHRFSKPGVQIYIELPQRRPSQVRSEPHLTTEGSVGVAQQEEFLNGGRHFKHVVQGCL